MVDGFDAPARSTEAFLEKVFDDTVGTVAIAMAAIGDQLGLFKSLAASGPVTSRELAANAEIDARYAREWLSAVAAGGYVDYDKMSGRFALPKEHIPVLADEGEPDFLGGLIEWTSSLMSVVPQLLTAFRTGGGVPQSAYPVGLWGAMERDSATMFENLLVEQWLPQAPDILAKLKQGGSLADIGCGSGGAILKMAAAFPNARFTGYDAFPPQVERARANAMAAGFQDRVAFDVVDCSKGLPDMFDIITTFDVVHDAVDPLGLMTSIRKALKPGGIYLIQEFKSGETLEENLHPLGSFLYGVSVLYCLSVSMAERGTALGTAGMPESVIREYGSNAGFGSVTALPIENMFNNFYELRIEGANREA